MRAFLRDLLEPLRRNGIFDVDGAIQRGRIVRRRVAGVDVCWLVTNANDEIQARQIAHGFYELAELEQLREDIGPRRAVLDVGANIGNHSIFFLKRMGCRRLIGVEPHVVAARHLLVNLALNQDDAFDLSLHGVALGDHSGSATMVVPPRFNLGMAKVELGGGAVAVITGDELLRGEAVDLIKIDVEGMELAVLGGLAATLAAHRPAIYVEASEQSRSSVVEFAAAHGYEVKRETRAYQTQFNLTLLPRPAP